MGVWVGDDGIGWDALKQPRWLGGVASVGSVSADPCLLYPAGAEGRFRGKRVSSCCLLQTRMTNTTGMTINYFANTFGGEAAREDGFGSLPALRLSGVRSGVRKVLTRLLSTCRTYVRALGVIR